jgi:hypothetical protein
LSLLFPLFLWCPGCGDDSSGPPEHAAWTISSEPSVRIGEGVGDPEYLFSQISKAVLLPDGRIVVADRFAKGLRLFLPDGTFDREVGRRGEGPGELAGISAVEVAPPDTLVVHDRSLSRLSRFLTTGTLASVHRFQAVDGHPEIYLGEFSNGDFGFAWISLGGRQNYQMRTDLMRMARFSKTGQLTHHLGSHPGMVRSGSSPLAFSPHLQVGMIGDSLYLTDGLVPEIQVWDGQGSLVRTIQVPVPEVDPSEAWPQLEEVLSARGNKYELQWLEGQPRDVPIPRISMMLVDDQDRLWVKPYEPRTDSHLIGGGRCRGGTWLIMETSGAVIARTELPEGLLLLDVRGNRLLGETQDDLGVERVQVHAIIR